jgi:uroporphyrinogen decarboxylase
MMTPRECVLAALRREEPDRVPVNASFSPAIKDRFRQETGSENPAEYFGMEMRGLGRGPTRRATDFSAYHSEIAPGRSRIDEWGVGWIRGSVHHFEDMSHPMASFTKLDQFERYPYPDVDAPYRYEKAAGVVRDRRARGVASVGTSGHIFECAWKLRGLESTLMDMMAAEDLAASYFDRVTALVEASGRQLVRAGVDVMHTGDDVATQRGMMMSPELWRKWIKPRFARVIAAAKEENPEVLISYHCDGDCRAILPELVEIGVEVLNPVQPECMDPAEVKRDYGERLAFWGTVGTQTTLPFGTADEVRRVVKKRIETVGAGGGLLLAPTHLVEPDVPWENVLAFFEAARRFGTRERP